MRKITTGSIVTLLFAIASGLILTLLSGCESRSKVAMTALPTSSYDGGTRRGISGAPHEHRLTGASANALPSTGDEVWIIARREHGVLPSQNAPGSGALMTKVDEKEVPLPLKHTEVRAFIQGFIGTVEVAQQFQNPYSSKIEAVYVFRCPMTRRSVSL